MLSSLLPCVNTAEFRHLKSKVTASTPSFKPPFYSLCLFSFFFLAFVFLSRCYCADVSCILLVQRQNEPFTMEPKNKQSLLCINYWINSAHLEMPKISWQIQIQRQAKTPPQTFINRAETKRKSTNSEVC